jgi:hypothetical protein
MKFLVTSPRQGSKQSRRHTEYKTPRTSSKLTYPINILSYTVLPHRKQVYSPSCNNNSWLIIYPTRTHNQHLHPCMPCWSESTCKLHSIQSRSLRSLKRKVSTDPVAMPRHNERKRRPLVGRAYVCVESQYSTNVVQRDPPCWSEPNITFVLHDLFTGSNVDFPVQCKINELVPSTHSQLPILLVWWGYAIVNK